MLFGLEGSPWRDERAAVPLALDVSKMLVVFLGKARQVFLFIQLIDQAVKAVIGDVVWDPWVARCLQLHAPIIERLQVLLRVWLLPLRTFLHVHRLLRTDAVGLRVLGALDALLHLNGRWCVVRRLHGVPAIL